MHERPCVFAQVFSCVRERVSKTKIDPPAFPGGGGYYKYLMR